MTEVDTVGHRWLWLWLAAMSAHSWSRSHHPALSMRSAGASVDLCHNIFSVCMYGLTGVLRTLRADVVHHKSRLVSQALLCVALLIFLVSARGQPGGPVQQPWGRGGAERPHLGPAAHDAIQGGAASPGGEAQLLLTCLLGF
eukprot:scaffold104978_cov31-Prasinocladus_malaysianus.AAC.1